MEKFSVFLATEISLVLDHDYRIFIALAEPYTVSMPRRPGAGPVLADMTAPSRTARAGPVEEWKMVQLWPTVDGPLLASLHVAIVAHSLLTALICLANLVMHN